MTCVRRQYNEGRAWIIVVFVIALIISIIVIKKRESIVSVLSSTTQASVVQPAETTPVVAPVQPEVPVEAVPAVSHQQKPGNVHGIYVTSWIAGSAGMNHIFDLLNTTPINSVVIDIKDATGRLSYEPLDPDLLASGVGTKRIAHLPELIQKLHDKHIYVIGRVAVFQDPYFAQSHPEDGFTNTKTGEQWKDPKGILWLDPSKEDIYKYVTAIAKDAYAQGFDEINLDYVRYPSDGITDLGNRPTTAADRVATLGNFFSYVDEHIRGESHVPLSADIFGETLTAHDDMGIGQKLETIAAHVDYVCPMIYPSHFADGSYGYKKPAEHPYDIIHHALADGIAKLTAANIPTDTLRPWMQDFNLGAIYTVDMVEAQTNAALDLKVHDWLYWDPRTVYTQAALQ